MIFCVLCCAIMFLRSTIRRKDGKEHRYWSLVENRRLRDGRVVQRAVLYLGEINSSQEFAWRRSIEVLDETAPTEPQTIALFPEDRWRGGGRRSGRRPATPLAPRASATAPVGRLL